MENASSQARIERSLQLLADRAVERLDGAHINELSQLLNDYPELDESVLDRTAAALDLAFDLPRSPLPEALYSRLLTEGRAVLMESRAERAADSTEAQELATDTANLPSASNNTAPAPIEPPLPATESISIPPEPPLTEPPASVAEFELPPPSAEVIPGSDPLANDSAEMAENGTEAFAAPKKKRGTRKRERERSNHWLPWSAAAAGLVIALAAWLWPLLQRPAPQNAEQQRADLLAKADTQQLPWQLQQQRQPNAAAGINDVSGDVIWHGESQQGYMRFQGLLPNDPTERQYQAWIVDAERDQRYPINAGVFDVPVAGQPVVVPLAPALSVGRPELFVVTLEPAGGVVVSDRKRLVVSAEP